MQKSTSENSECLFCESCVDILECVAQGQITANVLNVLKPVCCPICNEKFPDETYCGFHIKSVHESDCTQSTRKVDIDARKLTLPQLRKELENRGLSSTGTKNHLVKRLRGALAIEK